MLDLEKYDNYKAWLKDRMAALPKRGHGEARRIAAFLDVNSTMVSQILSGSKDFTLEQAEMMTQYFALKPEESEYFILLVQRERAGTTSLKKLFSRQIAEKRKTASELSAQIKPDRHISESERAEFYSSYLYSAIRLYCSIGTGKMLSEICERFQIPRLKVANILQFLERANLVIQQEGRYCLAAQTTLLDRNAVMIGKHHTNWHLKALERVERVSDEEMLFSGPLSIGKKEFATIREDLLQLLKRASKLTQESEADDIGCLILDLFWIDR